MRKANVTLSSLAVAVVLATAFVAPTVISSPAEACGVAYPAGSYARVAGERAVIVWDAAAKREHFVRRPTFDGDAKDFGYFMPTPTVPDVAKESNALIDRVASLASPLVEGSGGAPGGAFRGGPGAVAVMQTLKIDDFEIVTLRADSSDKLGEWLKAHAFVDRPSLRAWAAPYLAKGWVISAMRYVAPAGAKAAPDAGASHGQPAVETPTLRFSFAIDAPFYPYTEPQTDAKDEAAYLTRTGQQGLETRPLFVWLVANEPLEAFQGASLSGPYLHASHEVPSGAIASALGDTTKWGFNPSARATWTVTYLNQFEDRVAKEDVVFGKAKVLLPPAPVAANAELTTPIAPAGHGLRALLHSRKALGAFGLLALVLLVVVVIYRELVPAPKRN